MIHISNEKPPNTVRTLTITISGESDYLLHSIEVAVLNIIVEHKRDIGDAV